MVTASDRFTEPYGARFFGPDDVVERGCEPLVFPDILEPFEHRTRVRDETLPVPHTHVKSYILDRHKADVGQHQLAFSDAGDLRRLTHPLGFWIAVLVPLADHIGRDVEDRFGIENVKVVTVPIGFEHRGFSFARIGQPWVDARLDGRPVAPDQNLALRGNEGWANEFGQDRRDRTEFAQLGDGHTVRHHVEHVELVFQKAAWQVVDLYPPTRIRY